MVFTGHSMGAAIAAMVAYQAVVRYPVFRMRLYLVLLGSPRFARRTFTAWLNSELRYRILQCAPSLSPPPPQQPPPHNLFRVGVSPRSHRPPVSHSLAIRCPSPHPFLPSYAS